MISVAIVRNILAAALGAAGAQLVTKFFSHLANSNILERRYARKLAHISTAPLFFLTFPLYTSAPYSRYLAALIPISFAIRIARDPEKDSFSAAVARTKGGHSAPTSEARGLASYGFSVGLLTAIGWRNDVATYIAVSTMTFGDAAADLIGSAINGPVVPLPRAVFMKRKTVPGTLAFIAASVGGGMGMVGAFNRLGLIQRHVAWQPLLKVALAAASVELLPLEDNLTVPLCAFVVTKRVLGVS